MTAGLLDQIVTPGAGNRVIPGVTWCADNGVFGGTYPGDKAYLRWLSARRHLSPWCAFAVAPDVVCDAAATLARSAPMLPRIRRMGFPAALVAQNGLEHLEVPWSTFDVLFIGGDDGWKEGPAAAWLTAQAHARGKPVHMGRVNTRRRLRIAQRMGCDTADGTCLTRGPDKNLPQLLAWLRQLHWSTLFDHEAAP